ncbi:ABC-type multidrug transport system, ATPase and permease component [Rhizobium leguminosarum bv. trifolii WSM2297]|uniref:ABC-type multidrug transport system, ATPase and permease component n=1 Tax=Rhizobium leguminosarum bv. trifolii WSM2297 TaxID=754762 RepID=J0WBT3_RHILT|nr:ABC transporter ATP-binding protein [Rhizobium leguminosarum]EJC82678.1 ABC-type multidrug transport system, ATPase and permease component [Rhizobium leguminosarum bv. trifolii WSM2297]
MKLPIKESLALLDPKTRRKLPLMTLSFAVAAALDAIGVALFFPLVLALVDPASSAKLPMLGRFFSPTELAEPRFIIFLLACLIACVFVFKNILSVTLLSWQYKVLFTAEAELGSRLYASYLQRPWPSIANRNSSELIRNASVSCSQIFLTFIIPLFTIIVNLLLFCVIFVVLLLVDTPTAVGAAILVAIFGGAYFWVVKAHLHRIGVRFQDANFELLNELKQGIGAGREIRVLGRQDEFVRRLRFSREKYANAQALRNVLTQLPRYYLEVVLVFVVLAIISIMAIVRPVVEIAPVLAVFGFASLRLMDATNAILGAAQQMRIGAPAVIAVSAEFRDKVVAQPGPKELDRSLEKPGETGLVLENVNFAYGRGDQILRNVDLRIEWGECLGIVGKSGSGKSTLFDIMIGLLPPTAGTIRCDGSDIAHQRDAWLARIGYVPQFVYLSDESLRQNIAFGVAEASIDNSRVAKAIELAQLTDFVNQLPRGVVTLVGEQGAAISGGQRQRIGIARALYHDPDVIFMDEATSALDNETESAVVETLESLKGDKTIVVIAHRLSTLKPCDRILLLEDGALRQWGQASEAVDDEHQDCSAGEMQ